MLKPNLLVLFLSLMLRNGDMDVKIDRYDMVTDVNIIVSKSTELLLHWHTVGFISTVY